MLPYLKRNQEASASGPIETVERKPDMDEFDSLEVAAHDLMQAIKAGDAKALASALRAAFELCDAALHKEGDHE